jgi:hypothetical protein
MAMKHKFIVSLVAFLMFGCASSGHKEFYTQVTPVKYPPNAGVMVFEYQNVNLKEVYELLFSDFLIIGHSSFNGPYEPPAEALAYAESIGADIFLASSQFLNTRTSFINLATPTSSTTYLNGYSGSGSFHGTATTYGTRMQTVPIVVHRYDQAGIFLRNVNNILPLWEKTTTSYIKTELSELDGTWHNENYTLDVYRSGQQIGGFILKSSEVRGIAWHEGQIKFLYNFETGSGIYLLGDRTPMPAKFRLNKFGHLEVTLVTFEQTFSFARQM